MGKRIGIFQASDYEQTIAQAAEVLKKGGVVVMPTETVYGAAGILTNPGAMERLRKLPPAQKDKPLIIHLARKEDAFGLVGPVNALGRRMINKLFPGPVALVFQVSSDHQTAIAAQVGVAPSELFDGQAITLRCPDHIVSTDLLGRISAPVVIRRAGARPNSSVQRADAVEEEWGDLVDMIVDAGPTKYSRASTMVALREDGYEIVRAGVYDQRIIDRLLRTTILFVCSGNTCRSPMAEALARKLMANRLKVPLPELEKQGYHIVSAGSSAFPGARATGHAVEAVGKLGGDLSRHRSRALSVELVHQADVIFAMGEGHARAVRALVPTAADKIHTLDPAGDIDDPIGGDYAVYSQLAVRMKELIARRLDEFSQRLGLPEVNESAGG